MTIWIISAIAFSIFFMLGWSGAQKEFAFTKLAISCLVTCLPLSVIWWVFELIDWPTSLDRLIFPLAILWAPYLIGTLVHQLVSLLHRDEG